MLCCSNLQTIEFYCTKKQLTRGFWIAYDRTSRGFAVPPPTTQPPFHGLVLLLRCCALHHKNPHHGRAHSNVVRFAP